MKAWRKVKMRVEHFEVGDQIKVKLPGETHTATAIQTEDGWTLFFFDDCLDEAKPMNKKGGTEGGYEKSDMRAYLQKIANRLPWKFREKMVPFENGDLLQLLSLKEACGCDTNWNDCDGQIPWMKDRRNRIATRKRGEYAWFWLRDVVSGTHFAIVNNYGFADILGPSNSYGVRPVFYLKTKGEKK